MTNGSGVQKGRRGKLWCSDSVIRVSVIFVWVCCDDVRVAVDCVVVVNDGQLSAVVKSRC